MAVVTSAAGALILELNGQSAGPLRMVQPAGLKVDMVSRDVGRETVVRRSAQVALGEMAAEADLIEPGPLVDWLQTALNGDLSPRAGAVVQSDANFNQRRRIDFRGARLSSLAWPALDATNSKQPFTLALRWLVDAVDDATGSGKLKASTSRRKALQTANFRVQGLPFGGDAVVRVDLPTLQVAWASDRVGAARPGVLVGRRQLGEAAITIHPRQADAARSWVGKLVADGSIDESEGLVLQIELLDATLKKVLASIELSGCLLSGVDEDPLLAVTDRVSRLVLRFDVGGIKLNMV